MQVSPISQAQVSQELIHLLSQHFRLRGPAASVHLGGHTPHLKVGEAGIVPHALYAASAGSVQKFVLQASSFVQICMLFLPPLTVRSRGTGEGIRGAGRRRIRVAPVVGGAGRRPRPWFRRAEWPRTAPRLRCLLLWFPWRWGGRIRETIAPFQEACQFRI